MWEVLGVETTVEKQMCEGCEVRRMISARGSEGARSVNNLYGIKKEFIFVSTGHLVEI